MVKIYEALQTSSYKASERGCHAWAKRQVARFRGFLTSLTQMTRHRRRGAT
jgi:hypothetical protein